jgi:hypothetical protein
LISHFFRVAEKLFSNNIGHLFVLGKGPAMPIAFEGIFLPLYIYSF